MKKFAVLTLVTLCSARGFAGAGGQYLSCTDESGKVKANISVTATGNKAETKGFENSSDSSSKGADRKMTGHVTASILTDEQESMVSAFAIGSNGGMIQIVASELTVLPCRSCAKGPRIAYLNAVVTSAGDYSSVIKSNLTCELKTE